MATKIHKITIIDASTHEKQERQMNESELIAYKEFMTDVKTTQNAIELQAQTKAQAKAALLERLGITEDEAKLLLS